MVVSQKADIIARACAALDVGEADVGQEILRTDYPFIAVAKTARRYTEQQFLRVFYRDGFTDRYSGAKLVHPGALRVLSVVFPGEFPVHLNWDMTQTHFAFYELLPTIDLVVPVARGGADDETNWVTTSLLRNSAKAHWTLEELGWTLVAPGRSAEWDGLAGWFVGYLERHPELALVPHLGRWLRATTSVQAELS
ncbi:hypothetical protein Rwratislav_44206 [Rhodococcus wratislaviensis IFP 2016]|nr:hypothetical protein Rwratislav_44206 [Rhodococcus wratislaviensis IFP 2016]